MLKKLLKLLLSLFGKSEDTTTDPPVIPGPPPPKGPINQHGPLKVENGKFVLPSGKPIFLGGVSTGWELQDGDAYEPLPQAFDWGRFVADMQGWGLNYLRGWVVEHTLWDADHKKAKNPASPMAWLRTGPGLANDGQERFDLTKPNPRYYMRLRSRVEELSRHGIYYSVMLGQGVSLWTEMGNRGVALEHWKSLAWNPANNVNGFDVFEPGWEAHREVYGPIWEAWRSLIRHHVEELAGLPNVLFEIANEDRHGTMRWQNAMVNELKSAMAEILDHEPWPVGVSFRQGDGDNAELCASPADWIQPKVPRGQLAPNPCPGKASLLSDDHFHIYATRTDYPSRALELGHAGFEHLHPAGRYLDRKTDRAKRMTKEHEPMAKAIGQVVREANR